MKRHLPFAIALVGLFSSLPTFVQVVHAQDPVAAAAREEAADNYRTVSAKVNRLEEDLLAYQSRLLKLTDEIHRLRQEVDRQKNRNENAATLEKISRLQDAIKQVDEARLEDNKKVMAEFARLRTFLEKAARGMSSAPPPPADDGRRDPAPSRTNPSPGPKPPAENSSTYTVRKGDTLSGIAAGLRASGYKVSTRQIEEANPGVNWAKLAIGREIIIPPPSPSP